MARLKNEGEEGWAREGPPERIGKGIIVKANLNSSFESEKARIRGGIGRKKLSLEKGSRGIRILNFGKRTQRVFVGVVHSQAEHLTDWQIDISIAIDREGHDKRMEGKKQADGYYYRRERPCQRPRLPAICGPCESRKRKEKDSAKANLIRGCPTILRGESAVGTGPTCTNRDFISRSVE